MKDIEKDILDYFPYDKYGIREAQRQVLQSIENAILKGKKYIIIQAPTGVGKSAISFALLRYFGSGYVCSSTKALQNQYLDDFTSMLTVKGRGNYDCLERKDGVKCDKGACEILKTRCEKKPSTKITPWPSHFSIRDNITKYWGLSPDVIRCPYWITKVNALNNFAVVHNYKYILTEANFIGEFTKRKVLISDEGHNVESTLIDFIKLPITEKNLDNINKFLDSSDRLVFIRTNIEMANYDKLKIHVEWVKEINSKISIAIDRIKTLVMQTIDEKNRLQSDADLIIPKDAESRQLKKELINMSEEKYLRLDDLQGDFQAITTLQENQMAFFLRDVAENLDNWVVKEDFTERGAVEKIEFQPIRVNKYAEEKYLRLGDLNIIMSATILDHTRIASDLGIDIKDAEYIEIEPPFPAENHKIFNLGLADFGWCKDESLADKEAFFKAIVGKIDLILDMFPDDRGIIHCTTYEVMNYIKKYSEHFDRLTTHNTKDRAQKLEEHKTKIGSVLLSPSMTEGIDLKGDFSRFQVLVKVPYPDLKDERISKRKEVDPASYPFKTANTIIQSIGRSVRSENDYAVTFTLDSRFEGFCRKNSRIMSLYTRHVQPISKLKELDCLQGKTQLVEKLTEKVHRQKNGVKKLKWKLKSLNNGVSK